MKSEALSASEVERLNWLTGALAVALLGLVLFLFGLTWGMDAIQFDGHDLRTFEIGGGFWLSVIFLGMPGATLISRGINMILFERYAVSRRRRR